MTELGNICEVEKVFHVSGDLNVADIGTHAGAKASDLGPDSLWQRRRAFLSCRRDLWPVSRDFVKVDVPDEEVRTKRTNLFAAIRVMCCGVKTAPFYAPEVWNAVMKVMLLQLIQEGALHHGQGDQGLEAGEDHGHS